MKDNEIIKAFELCFASDPKACSKCPYREFGKLCKIERNRDALNLINLQKAEIERLKEKLHEQDLGYRRSIENCVREYNIVSNKAYSEYQERVNYLKKQLKSAKAEAIKEFAERLKHFPQKGRIDHNGVSKLAPFIDDADIDIIENEMTGEKQ